MVHFNRYNLCLSRYFCALNIFSLLNVNTNWNMLIIYWKLQLLKCILELPHFILLFNIRNTKSSISQFFCLFWHFCEPKCVKILYYAFQTHIIIFTAIFDALPGNNYVINVHYWHQLSPIEKTQFLLWYFKISSNKKRNLKVAYIFEVFSLK